MDAVTLAGRIYEILPDGRFGVLLDNDARIIARESRPPRTLRTAAQMGSRVCVRFSNVQADDARIVGSDAESADSPAETTATLKTTAQVRFYLEQVDICRISAVKANLANQRDKFIQAQAAWQSLADKAIEIQRERAQRESEAAARGAARA